MKRKHPFLIFSLSLLILAIFIFIGAYILTSGMRGFFVLKGEKIGLVRIEGVITDSRDIIDELKKYGDDDSIKAILLRINSPGGAVVPAQEVYGEIRRIRREKHKVIVASMGSVAASGGYYIASAADKIIANPGTITGSIGVILELANIEGLMDKVGIKNVVIKSGKYKDIGSIFRSMTDEERKLLQDVINDTYNQFVEAVSEGRGLPKEKILPIADGRIFTGRQAKQLGLVDDLGGLEDAIKVASNMAGIKGKPYIVERKRRISIFDILWNMESVKGWISRGHGLMRYENLFSLKYLFTY